ncbi:nickel/cobalt efflux transporter [Roseospira visakhapatnamensis]|uniref:Nickel/cobalt efflux system n=1 Tax=Roseospira visakhapatnamensis TaxID=390880 RepID=A0A7W6WAI3_9PROT|nr:nickel/cobalt efflux transporter [Roseospira visakhapatnamensis]MBB4266526.1 nickel/cobalt exporter [Roseospira visakhapatnamensis]
MDLATAITQGTGQPVLLVGMALALGALHGLEPGHSKTMMAAFIIAARGTVTQAVVLGLSAAVSHTLIVWILALLALRLGEEMIGEDLEPWFMMASGAIIVVIALWMAIQARRAARAAPDHGHDHDHDHTHSHDHARPQPADAHARAHARAIEDRFGAGNGRATMTQTLLFGLTGGLIPCSAAITVLILCLHLDQFWLGVGLVGAFSGGLAVTLVAAGVIAAYGVRYVAARTRRFDRLLAGAPYLSAALIGVIGLGMVAFGWSHLPAPT